jgi:ribosome-binding protein aMBF1 (putative translation factor)
MSSKSFNQTVANHVFGSTVRNDVNDPSDQELLIAFGKALRFHRKSAELSQGELAARARLNRTYISDVERGARNLSLVSMHRLAAALAIPVAAFFPVSPTGWSANHSNGDGAAGEVSSAARAISPGDF